MTSSFSCVHTIGMSTTIITKAALSQSLKECMATTPLEKISIEAICSRCGLNRKSFYYHFGDKYQLVNWIYDQEMGLKLYEELDKKPVDELALMLCRYFEKNRVFYCNALEVRGPNSFRAHFDKQLEPLVERTLQMEKHTSFNPEEIATMVGDFILTALYQWLEKKPPTSAELFLSQLKTVGFVLTKRVSELLQS